MKPARLAAAAAALALAIAVAPARPAGADAPTPTDYRSEVVDVQPALPDGVDVEVVGGDSFLELRASGHEVVVPDYGGAAPYLRFGPDGTVERNRLAVATTANEDRFGTSDAEPDPDAEPDWEVVATDGRYAWHDHRIHWMSPAAPRAVDDDGRVDLGGPDGRWQVPVTVDGTDTVITGQLWLVASPPWWPAALAGAAVAALVVAAGRRRAVTADAAGLAAAVGAVAASVATIAALPAGIAGSWVPVAVSGVAVVASLATFVVPTKVPVSRVAAASALIGWGLTRVDVLTRAVIPTVAPVWADRTATVLALAVGLALAAVALAPPTTARPPRSAVPPPEPTGL